MTVHWSYRYSAFAASVFTLSLFFAGWRQVNMYGQVADWALLAGGTLSTMGLLGLQGYWIYFEEKKKGSLRKRIALFETIHKRLTPKEDFSPPVAPDVVSPPEKGKEEK